MLLIDRLVEREELALGLDIIVDEPSRCVRYRNRPIVPTDLVYLRALNAAMTELHPEASVQAFHPESAGLVISVVGSSNLSVQLEVGVTEYLDDPDPDIDRIRLDVNRAALDEPVDIADSMIDVFVPINEGVVSDMAYLVEQLNLSGTLQYFQVQSLARDFDEEQVAAIRLHGVPRALDLPTEMAVITALRSTHVAAFAGTTGAGNQWIVILERALASPGDRLRYFADRSERLHTCDGTDTTIYLSEEQLRVIYADAGVSPQTDLIGFTSLLMGLQVEAFGYPLVEVVANMNAECAFLGDEEHDCEGSFFADIGAVWANKFQMINRTTDYRDDTATATAGAGTDVSATAIATSGELPMEINLTTPAVPSGHTFPVTEINARRGDRLGPRDEWTERARPAAGQPRRHAR